MGEPDQRRAVLSAILNDPKSPPETLLRAIELSERLDAQPDADPGYAVWQQIAGMSPEQLDREVKALGAPLMTGLAYGDDADFEAEVEKRATLLANEKTAELRRERHQLREALKRAEERLQPPTPAKATKPTTEAPSAPDKPQEDAGAVVADLLAARERLWPDGPPRGPFSRS